MKSKVKRMIYTKTLWKAKTLKDQKTKERLVKFSKFSHKDKIKGEDKEEESNHKIRINSYDL